MDMKRAFFFLLRSKSSLIYRERIRRSVLNTSETPNALEQIILNKCSDGKWRTMIGFQKIKIKDKNNDD